MPIEAHEALDDQLLLQDYAYQVAKVGKKLKTNKYFCRNSYIRLLESFSSNSVFPLTLSSKLVKKTLANKCSKNQKG